MAHWNSFSLPKKKWWFSISLKVISGYIPKKIKRYNMAILVIKMVIKSPEGISLFFPTTSHWCCRGLLTPVARPGGPGWTLSRTNAPHGLPGEDRVWGGWIKMFSGRGEFLGYSNYYWINIFIGSYLFYIYIFYIYYYSSYHRYNDDTLVFWCQLSKFGVFLQLGDHGFHEDILLADFSSQPSILHVS